jgi:LL-H family phage holin
MDIQTTSLEILQLVITAVLPAIFGYLTFYIKKHFSVKQIEMAQSIAKIGVAYAQQLELSNPEKFDAAFKAVKSFAAKHGLKYSDEQWTGLIEAAVNQGKQGWAALAANALDIKKEEDNPDS